MARTAHRYTNTAVWTCVALAAALCLAIWGARVVHKGTGASSREDASAADVGGSAGQEDGATGGGGLSEDALDQSTEILEELGLDPTLSTQGWSQVTEEEGGIASVARSLLVTYRDAGDCVLAQSGYLDLFGSVWSCVVYGGDWADVCLVGELEGGERCQVRVLHLTSEELFPIVGQDDQIGEEE